MIVWVEVAHSRAEAPSLEWPRAAWTAVTSACSLNGVIVVNYCNDKVTSHAYSLVLSCFNPGALSLCGRYPQLFGHPDQVGERFGLHLMHHLTAMNLHCDLACAQLAGDLLVKQPGHNEPHHIPLSRREL